MDREELKLAKRSIDLALAAAKKRKSPRTSFLHHFATDPQAIDTIPILENFCFAIALFRQRSVESILEGKELIERLLAFQTMEGNFPLYLHDFPRCYDPWMGLKVAPILVQILRHFGPVIGTEMKNKILSAIEKLVRFSISRNRPPLWEHRLHGICRFLHQELDLFAEIGEKEISFSPTSPDEWFEWIVTKQLASEPISETIPYHPGMQMVLGGAETQEKGEPRPSPLDWIFAERGGFSERLLADHPSVLLASQVFPIEQPHILDSSPFVWMTNGTVRLLWKGKKIHSLAIPHAKFLDDKTALFELSGEKETKEGMEASLFCDLSNETELFINGQKGTVFYLGDTVQIRTPALHIDLCFELIEGTGDFCGQILRANRPSQIAAKGALLYEAFDWQIGLRTLRRSSDCRIRLAIQLSST